jgi:hypothetical protein
VVAELGVGISLAVDRREAGRPFIGASPSPSSSASDAAIEARAAAFRRAREEKASAVRALLERRAKAVLSRNKPAFLSVVDPKAAAFRAKQSALFDALSKVPIGSWRYDVDAERETPPDDAYTGHYKAEVWIPEVRLFYALKGFDPEPTVLDQQLSFVRRPTGWFLGNDDDFAGVASLQTARELWDFGPVEVVQTANTLVVGRAGRRRLLAEVARISEESIPRVTGVWGRDWPGKVVILVPESQAELGTIIEEGNDLSQIAAVAVAQLSGDRTSRRAVGNRIIVNPPNFSRLGRLGKRVVLQHEITHVATRADTGPATPGWLVEGFADYVGYLGTDVSVRAAARELGDEVRAGKVPAALPADTDFDGTSERLSQTYEASWLACRLIARQTSERELVAFYRAMGALRGATEADVRAVWSRVLRTTPESFTKAWRAYLRQQLG